MQWMMLQQDEPEDYVIATGEQHSVRDFCTQAFRELGINLKWEGQGAEEVGMVQSIDPHEWSAVRSLQNEDIYAQVEESWRETPIPKVGDRVVQIDPRYFRPTEVETLLGDPSKAKKQLGWEPRISFQEMVREMVHEDLTLAKRDKLCSIHGFYVCRNHE